MPAGRRLGAPQREGEGEGEGEGELVAGVGEPSWAPDLIGPRDVVPGLPLLAREARSASTSFSTSTSTSTRTSTSTSTSPKLGPKRDRKSSTGGLSSHRSSVATMMERDSGRRGSPASAGQRQRSLAPSAAPSRRTSILHELHLQPSPSGSRPLSPHQVMILTPFGTPIPPAPSALGRSAGNLAAIAAPAMASSAAASGYPVSPQSYSRKRGSVPGLSMPHRRRGTKDVVAGASPGATAAARAIRPSVQQHLPASPSTLREQPALRSGEASPDELDAHEASDTVSDELGYALALPVPMTRSLSMPILTAREVSAVKEKEAELGIVRNEGWAWVSGALGGTGSNRSSAESESRYSAGSYTTASSAPARAYLDQPTSSSPPVFLDPFRRTSASGASSGPFGRSSVEAQRRSSEASGSDGPLGGAPGSIPSSSRRPTLARYRSAPGLLHNSAVQITVAPDRRVSEDPAAFDRGDVEVAFSGLHESLGRRLSLAPASPPSTARSAAAQAMPQRHTGSLPTRGRQSSRPPVASAFGRPASNTSGSPPVSPPRARNFGHRQGSWASITLADRAALPAGPSGLATSLLLGGPGATGGPRRMSYVDGADGTPPPPAETTAMRVLRAVQNSLEDAGPLEPLLTRQNRLSSWPRWQPPPPGDALRESDEDARSLPGMGVVPVLDYERRASLAPALLSLEKRPLGSWWDRRGSWAETQSSSRLIFLNLPPSTTPPSLTEHLRAPPQLAQCTLTDLKLVPRRRFAFVGFKDEGEAQQVKGWFDGSFWGGVKIRVDYVTEDALNPSQKPAKRPRLDPGPSAANATPLTKKEKSLREFMAVMKGEDAAAPDVPAATEDASAPTQAEALADDDAGEDGADIDDAEWLRRRKAAAIDGQADNSTDGPSANTSHSPEEAQILSTARLFIRNLSFLTTTDALRSLLEPHGEITEVHLPVASGTGKPLGTAFVQFANGEDACKAWRAVDGRTWMGRLVHVLPGRRKNGATEAEGDAQDGSAPGSGVVGRVLGKEEKNVKADVAKRRKEEGSKGLNWATLYMNSDAVASSVADRMGIRKSDILNAEATLGGDDDSAAHPSAVGSAVKLALAETNVIAETKKYFESHGVDLGKFDEQIDAQGRPVRPPRSRTILLVKNIPYGTSADVLNALFSPHGDIKQTLIPPAGTLAIIEFASETDASRAFKAVSYRRLGNAVVYLEKAPEGLLDGPVPDDADDADDAPTSDLAKDVVKRVTESSAADAAAAEVEAGSTLFVKNLSFATTSERMHTVFSSLPAFAFARVSTKPDPKNPSGPRLSMGFGFIGFKTKDAAKKAMSGLKGFKLDGHNLEVKFAQRDGDASDAKGGKSAADPAKQKKKTTKMIVKNMPFEASKKDIRDLFSAYGTLKSLRIPKKHNSSGRGFAFLDFATRHEAELAMEALKHTHLLGRHLVLEWAQDDEDVEKEVERLRSKAKEQAKAMEGGDERMGKRKKLGVRDGDKRGGDDEDLD